jgi:steroid delta-isomerase-like uncharacterized protein
VGTRRRVSVLLVGVAACAATAAGLRRRRRAKTAIPTVGSAEIVRRLWEEPWKGNWDVIETFVSPDYVGHDPSEPEPIRGPAGVRANVEKYLASFAGAAITVDHQVVEGEHVATRWTGRGTHTGEIAGIAPTGKDVTVSGITVSRFDDGLVLEEWTTWDTLGMLVQLGAVPAPAQA